jgi:nitrate reductase gamma subunit
MTFLALQRETIMILALVSLTVAGVVFALGALMLFLRERRSSRETAMTEPAEGGNGTPPRNF